MSVINFFPNDVFYALFGLNPQKAYEPDGVPPIILKNCAFVLKPCLVQLFGLCLSTSTFTSCWKYAHIEPVPKKGDCSNPSNYCPIALLSCLSKAFESILNRKIQKHLSTSDLLSDRQYEFRKGRSTGNLLSLLILGHPLLTVSLKLSQLCWTYRKPSIESGISLYFLNCPLLVPVFSFISSFISGRSISAVVDGHCSSPKPINSGIPQGSVLSPTLFLLFINDLSLSNCSIHSYADDSTLHFLTSFDRRPTHQDLQNSRL